jgi:aminoglycoside phosphotransferase (APT) family kinase protein
VVEPDPELERRCAALVSSIVPEADIFGITVLPGGLSATMTVVALLDSDGTVPRLVLRRVRDRGTVRTSLSLVAEFRLLVSLRGRGLPCPNPRLFDDSGTIFDEPVAVYDFVDGAPRVRTSDPVATGRAYADQLLSIHAVAATSDAGEGLPDRTAVVARDLAAPASVAEDFEMGRPVGYLRELLRARWPPPAPRRPCLLHGDFWAGNLLWKNDHIVAVIDWEDASVGDPMTDLATTRLDLLWAYGSAAMDAFTDRYLSARSVAGTRLPPRGDSSTLALWDLVAALRPAGVFSAWVADWADFGRPDMNAPTMRAQHRAFLDQALGALGVIDPA